MLLIDGEWPIYGDFAYHQVRHFFN